VRLAAAASEDAVGIKDYVGLVAYYAAGRTDALWPGP
jgi:hypothetical protein